MYRALDVAKYIIWHCKENSYSISNLKLQKLLYFVQAQFLVVLGVSAFAEDIEAWDFGPVVPEVYQYFKLWGSSEIPKRVVNGANCKIFKRDQEIIDEILKECAPYSANALMNIAHNQKPWCEVYEKYCNNVIKTKKIKEYFENNEC